MPAAARSSATLHPLDKAANAEAQRRRPRPTPRRCRAPRRSPGHRPAAAAADGRLRRHRSAARLRAPAAGHDRHRRNPAHEPTPARPLRPEVQPLPPRRAHRGALRPPRRRGLLLAHRAGTAARRRLRPDQRRSGHRQERRPAPARRTPRPPHRRRRRRHRPSAEQPQRLLPRARRPLRRRRCASHNRWGGFKALRARWPDHIAPPPAARCSSSTRPRRSSPSVFSELRVLASATSTRASSLCVVLAGDARLLDSSAREELLPARQPHPPPPRPRLRHPRRAARLPRPPARQPPATPA